MKVCFNVGPKTHAFRWDLNIRLCVFIPGYCSAIVLFRHVLKINYV